MTTQEIATKLVGFCRKGDFQTVYQELYAPNCVSIEPKGAMMEVCEGLEAMAAKGKIWNESIEEFHSSSVGDPIVAGNHIALTMNYDATFKEAGRIQMEEVCVYEVTDGKITKEQFFYKM